MTGVVAVAAMFEKLSVSVSPDTLSASGLSPQSTSSTTATPRGGAGSYTYAWTYTSGDTFGVSAPTSATTTFSKGGAAGSYSGVYTCTVTDAAGATASAPVSIDIELT